MNRTAQKLIFVILITFLASLGYGLNYMQVTNDERTAFNDVTFFWQNDTCNGPVRSNSMISIMNSPVYFDFVISTASDFWRGSGYNPRFFGPPPVFSAPVLALPDSIPWMKQQAIAQNHYFSQGDTMQARVQLERDMLVIWWTHLGQPFDTANFENYPLPDSAIVFFETPELHVFGTVGITLVLCASGRVGIEDNIVYHTSDRLTGQVVPQHPEKFAIITEGEIKILNTPQNGRGNSGGLGQNQTNPDLRDVVLNGYYVALGESFTFENQNDPDSGYDYGSVDERGYLRLWGGIAQSRRGYTHRSNRSGTGYTRNYHYDEDIRFWNLGLFNTARENVITPASLEFGQVTQGSEVSDTIKIFNDYVPLSVSNFQISEPYSVSRDSIPAVWHPVIRVAFHADNIGEFYDTLHATVDYYQKQISIPLHGICIPADQANENSTLRPATLALTAFPNPFNSSTEIRYSLPRSGAISLILYDVLGREIAVLIKGFTESGNHHLPFNGSDLASGVYFARLNAGTQVVTQKILLMK